MNETTEAKPFDQWVILEILGHHRYAGRLTEQTIAGCGFLRIDIPAHKGRAEFTKLFSPSSVYGITPTTEDIARAMAAQLQQEPISVYDLPSEMRARLTSQEPMTIPSDFDWDGPEEWDDENDHENK